LDTAHHLRLKNIHIVAAGTVSIFRWNGSLRMESSVMSIGITWLITLGATMGIRKYKLHTSQVRKRGNVGLNHSLIYIKPCTPLSTSFFYLPLFFSVAKRKKSSSVEKFLGICPTLCNPPHPKLH
jgi:hypothetical protein